MIDEAFNQFNSSIAFVKNLDSVFTRFSTTAGIDLSDVLRSEFVMAVSAFDSYVHQVTEEGMCEILLKKRAATPSYLKFRVSLDSFLERGIDPESVEGDRWLRNEIHEIHSTKTFQRPDDVADALRLVTNKRLWIEVAGVLKDDPGNVKRRLDLIVVRRNQIVHEADLIYDPISPGRRWPIDQAMTVKAVDFVESLVSAIHSVIK